VHIADNIRKPSEVLRKFLAGSKDSFLSVAFSIELVVSIIGIIPKGDVENEDLDNRLSNIESGENLVKCNEPEPVDMQEVNELMNEMSEFCLLNGT
jgi:hypothetical protein